MPCRGLMCLLFLGCSETGLRAVQPIESDTDTPQPPPEAPPDPGGVAGRICAPDASTWIVGAEVSITHAFGLSSTTTDGDGAFLLTEVPPGIHTVTVEKGSYSHAFSVEVLANETTELPTPACVEQGPIRIAVVWGAYDRIQDIVSDLGLDYDLINGPEYRAFLEDPLRMSEYDVIFLNCGFAEENGLPATAATHLRSFVLDGGSLYASDLAYQVVEQAWPRQQRFLNESLGYEGPMVGRAEQVTVSVIDPVLATLVNGNRAIIDFGLDGWAVVESTSSDVLLEGDVSYWTSPYYGTGAGYSALPGAPLAYRFQEGEGTVIYTSFHNETQTTPDMVAILQDIVLSL